MKDLNKIYSILKNGITYLPVSTEYINNMEKKLDIIFPDEFKIFYTKISNGAYINRQRLYNIEKIINKTERKQLNKEFKFQKTFFGAMNFQ